MADNENTDTADGTDGTDTAVGTLDLRPAKGSILYELLRLGLVFDHSDDGTAQTWCDYTKQLRADFTGANADKVTFTDMTTRLATDIKTGDLPSITNVITWQSGQAGEHA